VHQEAPAVSREVRIQPREAATAEVAHVVVEAAHAVEAAVDRHKKIKQKKLKDETYIFDNHDISPIVHDSAD
jgi:hypothetical protein